MRRAHERHDPLRDARVAAASCTRCPQLARTRTQVVFGVGNPDADLLLLGDAPGRAEDEQGVPLTGRSHTLLMDLLAEIGLGPDDVFLTGALQCRPPDNRAPTPGELERCRDHLLTKLDLVRPRVVCTLGTVATRVVRGRASAIVQVRGTDEVVVMGERRVRVLATLHPAAALYQRAGVEQLRADLERLPALLELPRPDPPRAAVRSDVSPDGGAPQLGLF